MKKRIFSGIRPTGSIHIGNYLGALKNWTELQNKYDSIFCIVDLHALTTPTTAKNLQEKIFDLAAVYLSVGLDPKKCLFFVQSHVPAHAELTWLLNTIAKIPELERMIQFKEKSKERRSNVNAGLLDYPVLMAADILLYQTDAVPVGEDQKQHVEIARTLAKRFNKNYGRTFNVPQVIIKKESARIMALDNPEKKMSKSASSPYNYIALTDSSDAIREKIKRAVTDSGTEIKYSPARPAIANLMNIYHCFSGLTFEKIEQKYQGKGYADFKSDLAELIIAELKPIRRKIKELKNNPAQIKKILDQGAKDARIIAQKTLQEVKKKMGLI
ncbi:MAG: tryptophan--tRNA ligase [Candidatus Portnoybacteria bacterium CG_4_10_14_0_2_um_filter_43_36]|uniref:Tryptophan--tRNA ligase n=2 Tax=Candidatus Portnoyibacteriota TaxID=1817913 RepID=A0A2M7YL07_9BACT|nr:MAG: tryptophan--tRNA ligase [Candidatus Portnoybacteria bacterium CG_4_10_14_0_2_um_filter_43_36]PJA63678.1 MAG: tryptophan--tRNA ligase [Candidatus Portnoybacteria bacterium CG_4_9_14_3_um_filter_43_11]